MKPAAAPSGQMDKTQLRDSYDILAPMWDAARSHMLEGVMPYIMTNLPARKGRALDIGCGSGQVLRRLSPEFEEVRGIDLSPKMLEAARQVTAGYSNVRFQEMDAEALAFEEETFDFVSGIAVLHHIDPFKGVSEAARVLRPGGRLLFMGPSRGGAAKSMSPTERGESVSHAPRRWARLRRIGLENLRLARALGLRNLLLWKRFWTHQVQANTRFLTHDQWLALAATLPGSQVGHYRYYVTMLWDKPGQETVDFPRLQVQRKP